MQKVHATLHLQTVIRCKQTIQSTLRSKVNQTQICRSAVVAKGSRADILALTL